MAEPTYSYTNTGDVRTGLWVRTDVEIMTRDTAHAAIVPILTDITGEIQAAHAIADDILDAIWPDGGRPCGME